ncbi:MAG: hypothetical protein ABI222_14650 [Opitutaceae bacterium]
MRWLKRSPVFACALGGLGLLVLAEGGVLTERWQAARVARRHLDETSRARLALAALRPAPTAETAALLSAELDRVTRSLATAQNEWRPAGSFAEGFAGAAASSGSRSEAFFDIATFIETMRTKARQAGVGLRPEERFGFGSYVYEAPDAGQRAAVLRERMVVQYLLEALLAAQPQQLMSVQRVRPVPDPDGSPGAATKRAVKAIAGRGGRAGRNEALDYFEPDARVSLREPGLVDTTAIRLVFTARTPALRKFLNQLTDSGLPMVVRAVEVAPAERGAGKGGLMPSSVAPFIAASWSRFTVTVEFVTLAVVPAAAS